MQTLFSLDLAHVPKILLTTILQHHIPEDSNPHNCVLIHNVFLHIKFVSWCHTWQCLMPVFQHIFLNL